MVKKFNNALIDFDKIHKGSRCIVSIGYDIDMPGDFKYLYDPSIPWGTGPDGPGCHGHLNKDVINYIKILVKIADNYNAKLQFFLEGNTLEDDISPWVEIIKKGHAVDQHTYSHIHLLNTPIDKVESEILKTKELMEHKLEIVNIGLRGPGGYLTGLNNRTDLQQVILKAGIKFVSTHLFVPGGRTASEKIPPSIESISNSQPYLYETGLPEIPFCGYTDRQFFDVDQGGKGNLEEWIEYLKKAVDFAYEHKLVYALVVHPSTSFKHDPEGKYLKQMLSYCREKEGIIICTYRDIYNWISNT